MLFKYELNVYNHSGITQNCTIHHTKLKLIKLKKKNEPHPTHNPAVNQ